ncbi:MAG TPA: BamA/TamA family outer membrane protein [Anaeromyxobacter sp.]
MRRALAAVLLLAAAGVRAQPYDPAFRWRTLETPHFRIHYHQGEEAISQVVAREAERAHALLSPRLGYSAPLTQIVLSDDQDDTNGSASAFFYDTIRLFVVPPAAGSELQDYRSWIRQLLQHEYTHILHMDHVGGVPAAFDAIFGKVWPPNAFTPPLFLEGLAVLNESEGDPASGRNAAALFDAEARTLALEGPFPRLDEAANPLPRWPVGQIPYLLGGRFMGYLQARYGPAAIAGFVAEQGTAMWPYAPSWAGRRFFGDKEFPELWDEYVAAERAYAEGKRAAVRARPVTAPAPLTHRGGLVEHPRFSPDGRFVAYADRGLDEAPGLRRVGLDGKDLGRVTVVDQNGTLALPSPDEAIVAIGEVFHEFRVYDDLYRVDLRSGRRTRLTRGERATNPDVAKDGTIVYVRRTGGGGTALARLRPGGSPEVLFERAGADVYEPALAPDGTIAFSLHEGGRRDIALWRDGSVERVTDDDALDTGPAWTPDGRFLLFASDRGGIDNLYAWVRATGRIRQVTNVETAAREPDVSPDGRTVVFASYSIRGWDLATIPLDEGAWLDPVEASTSVPAPAPPTAAELALPEPIPSRPYSAWPTVAPSFWFPLLGTDAAGPIYGAFTVGGDVLARHSWAAEGWWSVDGKEPGYVLAYRGGWSWPSLDLSSSLGIDTSPGPPFRLQRVWEYASTGATFTFTQLARALAIRVGWSGTAYGSIGAEGAIPPAWEPYRFKDGFLSEASFTTQYTDARRFTRSISPEEGRTVTLALGVAGPETGSDYRLARASAAVAQYLSLSRAHHVALALRLAGGVADGTIGGRAPFELGGTSSLDPLSTLLGGIASPAASNQLRGYPARAFGGTGFALANLELRFPIASPTRGYSTWPVFLRRVHAAVFLDAGDAFDLPGQVPIAFHPWSIEQVRFSTGAEVRLELVLGYYFRTDVRIGAARPLGALFGDGRAADVEAGLSVPDVAFYVTVGSSF